MSRRVLWGLCALLGLAGCGESPRPDSKASSQVDAAVVGIAPGAVLSTGAHDLAIVVHHAREYSAREVRDQEELAGALIDALAELHEASLPTLAPHLSIITVGSTPLG